MTVLVRISIYFCDLLSPQEFSRHAFSHTVMRLWVSGLHQ